MNNLPRKPKAASNKSYPDAPLVIDVIPENWNKTFPYAFMVIDAKTMQKASEWDIFWLPIPPESISVDTQFSTRLSPTGLAILEETNGIVFRTIGFNGSMGIAPDRKVLQSLSSSPESLAGFFDRSIKTGTKAIQDITNLVAEKPITVYNAVDPSTTGYAQIHHFSNYLASYADARKNGRNDLRLVFLNFKDNLHTVVSPQVFKTMKDAHRPHLYKYHIVVRALGNYAPGFTTPELDIKSSVNQKESLQNDIMNKIIEVRKALVSIAAVPEAIKGDFYNEILTPMQQAFFSAGDVLDITTDALRLPFEMFRGVVGSMDYAKKDLLYSGNKLAETPEYTFGNSGDNRDYENKKKLENSLNRLESSQPNYDRNTLKIAAGIQSTIDIYNSIIRYKKEEGESKNRIDHYNEFLLNAGVQFDSYDKGMIIPVPYGDSLEDLANRYLGSRDKWQEIAIANKLESPYFDENGFSLSVLGWINYDTIKVEANPMLYVGMPVTISSDFIKDVPSRVISINKSTDFVLTLDTSNFPDEVDTITSGTLIHFYTPNTIKPGSYIIIPSDEGTLSLDNLLSQGEVMGKDIMLSSDNDLIITSYGDLMIANGLTNAIQALRLKLNIKQGELPYHETFGVDLKVGTTSALDINLIKQQLYSTILSDPRFINISNFQMVANGGTVFVKLQVTSANNGGTFPVVFEYSNQD